MGIRVFAMLILSCYIFAWGSFAQDRFAPQGKITRLADGVYEIEHPDLLPDVPAGNTRVIIGDRSVYVVDSAYLPSSARMDNAQIREWTTKAVRYLMITHGHTD